MKTILQQALDLIEEIEYNEKESIENRESANRTEIPQYNKVCTDLADIQDKMVINLTKQLEIVKQQIITSWQK